MTCDQCRRDFKSEDLLLAHPCPKIPPFEPSPGESLRGANRGRAITNLRRAAANAHFELLTQVEIDAVVSGGILAESLDIVEGEEGES